MRTICASIVVVLVCCSALFAKADLSRLFDTWQVFLDVDQSRIHFDSLAATPRFIAGAPRDRGPVAMTTTDGMIDFGARGYPVRERKAALLFTEVSLPFDTIVKAGATADWWMRWYVNGKPVFDTDSGNGTNHFSPADHRFDLPLKKGANCIAVLVSAGSAGWRFGATLNLPPPSNLPLHYMVPAAELARSGIEFTPDIVYLDGPRKESLDLYRPVRSNGRKLSVVVYLHGGGWASGDKHDRHAQQLAMIMADSGYAVAAVNYLLNGESAATGKTDQSAGPAWPHNVEDCKAAISFLKKNAGTFSIDPNRIAVYGTSAGGHLALLLAFSMPDEIRCAIDNSGGADVSASCPDCFAAPAAPDAHKTLRDASPLYNIPTNPPPLLLLGGAYEMPHSSGNFHALIDSLDARHAVYEVEIGGKTGHVVPPDSRDLDMRLVLGQFLRNYLAP